MRQTLGAKKLKRLSKLLGKDFVHGMVRGNTDHRVDLVDSDGWIWRYWPTNWPDGRLERDCGEVVVE